MKLFTRLDSRNQAYSLRELLEANIAQLWAQAIEVSQAIDADADRTATLAALTPHPPPHLLAEALVAARAIKSKENRAKALAALAPRLPADQQPAVYAEALAAARAIESEGNRAKALAALAPHLASYPTLDDQFAPTLRVLAQRGYPALLDDLRALRPWLAALAKRRSLLALCADLATAMKRGAAGR